MWNRTDPAPADGSLIYVRVKDRLGEYDVRLPVRWATRRTSMAPAVSGYYAVGPGANAHSVRLPVVAWVREWRA